jgi:hypothetical protein
MPFEHSCFISYCHDEGIVMERLMKQVEDGLNSALGLYIKGKKVFTDKNLQPGDDFKKKLAKAICQSVCLIPIYTPSYEESDFCLREFAMMEKIEEKRMQLLGKKATTDERMIIPIIIRGKNDLPSKIADNIHFCDCTSISLSDFLCDISNHPVFLDKLDEIAKVIHRNYKNFEEIDASKICDSLELSKEEILPWRSYLFNWTKIENDNKRLKEHLIKKFNIDWIETKIEKVDDSNTKVFFNDATYFLLSLNDNKSLVKVTLMDEDKTSEFIAKMENGELNIYKKPMDPFPKM